MSGDNNQEFELIGVAIEALGGQTVPGGPQESVKDSTIEAMYRAEEGSCSGLSRLASRRTAMFRLVRFGAFGTTAVVIVIVLGWLSTIGISAKSAFGQMLAKVNNARSVRYQVSQTFARGRVMKLKCWSTANFFRMESDSLVFVADRKSNRAVQLNLNTNIAVKKPWEESTEVMNPVALLKDIGGEHAELVEKTKRGGKRESVYLLPKIPKFLGGGDFERDDNFVKIWVDDETHLPTRVDVSLGPDPDDVARFWARPKGASRHWMGTRMSITDFEWNVHFAPELFKVQIPDGFQIHEVDSGDTK